MVSTVVTTSHEEASSELWLINKSDWKKKKRIEMIRSMLSDHNGTKLEINNRKIAEKSIII